MTVVSLVSLAIRIPAFILFSYIVLMSNLIYFRDMPGQADSLISKMKADTSFDYENDWKLVTMFIGGNDLCDYCDDRVTYINFIFIIKHATKKSNKLNKLQMLSTFMYYIFQIFKNIER